MTNKIFKKKAYCENNQSDKQFFSFDVTTFGAKNFFFTTYKKIYHIITHTSNPNFYEDNTFSTGIKLFVDFDEKITFNTELARDIYSERIINIIVQQINNKLKSFFKIEDTPIVILISDTLQKMSLHFVFPDVVFNNIYEMKYFMNDISLIDQNVYKIGCFRMLYCSKKGKKNKLQYSNSFNYIKPESDYLFFLDVCICNVTNKQKVNMPLIITTIDNKTINIQQSKKLNYNYICKLRNYTYKNIDYDILSNTLKNLQKYSNNYTEWLIIAFCLKDLYLSSSEKEQQKIYKLFDTFSKTSTNYNKNDNKRIFMSLDPKIDVNYLFKMSQENYFFIPFYNYQEIIFNPKNHTNIIIKNEQYINIELQSLLKHKYIFIKSPPGTGKSYSLQKIIKHLNVKNIISLTSRVNLAGEHMKQLDLAFYLELNEQQFKTCDKLVIQLESLRKCNYKLFKNSIVILDEINSLLSHLKSPTMDNKRKDTYLYLLQIIKDAQYVIALDADLSDWNIQFLQDISPHDYIIYYNVIKNKKGTTAILYDSPHIMIQIMKNRIEQNIPFICSFDTLQEMNKIKLYLSKFTDSKEWKIYSSEVDYTLINTKEWIDNYVFFTPSIIYGIDYSHKPVEVFSFVYKNHLNSLQIYQMISRARQQTKLHVYCNQIETSIKYRSVDEVIDETELYEKNIAKLLPEYNNYITVDEKPYRTMHNNFKFIDSILKTNIRGYLEDILIQKGYDIEYNTEKGIDILEPLENVKDIKDNIIDLLSLDKDNLSEIESKLVSDNKFLDKHFNLRFFIYDKIDNKLIESISNNLFLETLKNKNAKLKTCKELMKLLDIDNLQSLNKDLSINFCNDIKNKWLEENMHAIKKMFNIRTTKYDSFTYYNIYTLFITIFKNLFDNELVLKKETTINYKNYTYYIVNQTIYSKHLEIMKKMDDNFANIDFNNF